MEYDCTACPVEGCARRLMAIRVGGKPSRWWRECRIAAAVHKRPVDGRNPVPATDRT